LLLQYPNDWKERVIHLRQIDWSRSNVALWKGRATDARGKLIKSKMNINLTANIIRQAYGLELCAEDRLLEEQFHS